MMLANLTCHQHKLSRIFVTKIDASNSCYKEATIKKPSSYNFPSFLMDLKYRRTL